MADEILMEILNRMESIDKKVDDIQTDVGSLKTDVGSLKTDVSKLQTDVGRLQTDMGKLQTDVHMINLKLENDIDGRLQNIESCYTSTYRRYADGIGDIAKMKDDIFALQAVVRRHGEQLAKISFNN